MFSYEIKKAKESLSSNHNIHFFLNVIIVCKYVIMYSNYLTSQLYTLSHVYMFV